MRCSNCDSEITLWMAMKQPTPFRFSCSVCKTRYKVSTPGMTAIFAVVVVLFALLTVANYFVAMIRGYGYGALFLLGIVIIAFFMEGWMNEYIGRAGTFTKIDDAASL